MEETRIPAKQESIYKENSIAELPVVRVSGFGAFLDGGTGNSKDDILLHKGQQTHEVKEGERVKVFLYHDPHHRLTASMRLPQIAIGGIGYAPVLLTTRFGAFVDVGTERGIFLPFSQMIENCGGLPEGDNKVLAGGPMMGKAVISLDVPVTKGTNSITVLTDADAHRKKAQPCIRCAKCVDACPMGLEPYLLATLSVVKDYERLEAEEVTSCIACGSCQFTCPSHRPILDNIINGKAAVMGIIRARNSKK